MVIYLSAVVFTVFYGIIFSGRWRLSTIFYVSHTFEENQTLYWNLTRLLVFPKFNVRMNTIISLHKQLQNLKQTKILEKIDTIIMFTLIRIWLFCDFLLLPNLYFFVMLTLRMQCKQKCKKTTDLLTDLFCFLLLGNRDLTWIGKILWAYSGNNFI